MGPLTDKIIYEMDSLSSLLDSVGEERWSSAVKRARSQLSASNYHGIEEAKQWFGTVGTLNDLIIHPLNGHSVSEKNVESVNTELQSATSRIYNLLREVERNASFE